MKLGAALAELKSRQSQLARLIQIRQDTMDYESNKKPKMDAKELTEQINTMIDDIRKLKLQIMKTNLETELSTGITLSEAIIKIGDLRSKIANYHQLVKYERDRYSFFEGERKTKDVIPQVEEKKIEEEIKKLNEEKLKLDNEIQQANWKVDLKG